MSGTRGRGPPGLAHRHPKPFLKPSGLAPHHPLAFPPQPAARTNSPRSAVHPAPPRGSSRELLQLSRSPAKSAYPQRPQTQKSLLLFPEEKHCTLPFTQPKNLTQSAAQPIAAGRWRLLVGLWGCFSHKAPSLCIPSGFSRGWILIASPFGLPRCPSPPSPCPVQLPRIPATFRKYSCPAQPPSLAPWCYI